jgi:GTP cyclohydrolase I
MEDVQNRNDERGIRIDRAGVSGLRYPIVVLDRANEKQHTIATLSMSVAVPHDEKGTHMSRFVEVLNEHRGEVTMRTMPLILQRLLEHLSADSAKIETHFPYFVEKAAPASGAVGLMDYECHLIAEASADTEDFILGVRVPVTSLCPCSKAISDYGAHNQRGYITIELRPFRNADGTPKLVWFEELVEIAESSASAPVYPLLKRPDERHVTMQAYDNPVFVEDMVRNVAAKLCADMRVAWFRVHAANQESIHNHDAFAEISWQRE